MGKTNKNDALDAGGLAILLRCGTLPESWIPPGELRDQRELLRTRMALRDLRTSLKHRIHAAIDRYGLHADAISDLFGKAGREFLLHAFQGFHRKPAMMLLELDSMDDLTPRIESIERVLPKHREVPRSADSADPPGLGRSLRLGLAGNWRCRSFPRAEHLASYAGLVPRIISSGTHRSRRHLRNVNHYLRWAFVEAATALASMPIAKITSACSFSGSPNSGHGRAIVAVARHLAEASYWVLRKRQPYRPPTPSCLRPSSGKRETRLISTKSRGECDTRYEKCSCRIDGEYMDTDEAATTSDGRQFLIPTQGEMRKTKAKTKTQLKEKTVTLLRTPHTSTAGLTPSTRKIIAADGGKHRKNPLDSRRAFIHGVSHLNPMRSMDYPSVSSIRFVGCGG